MFLYILEGRIHISIRFSGKDTYYGHLSGKIHSLHILVGRIHISIRFSENETNCIHLSGKDTCFYTF